MWWRSGYATSNRGQGESSPTSYEFYECALRFLSNCAGRLPWRVPIMAGRLGQMLHGIADTVMLGRVGVTELAASTFANALVHPPFVFGIGVLTCISMRVSQERGAGRPEAAAQTLRHGLILAAVGGAAVVALLFALIPSSRSSASRPRCWPALRSSTAPIAVSVLPALLILALKNCADAMARPWVPFGIMFGGVSSMSR